MPTVEELTKQMRIKPTKAHAVKMLSVLKCGLVTGVGQPKPGETCILGVKRMIFGLSHGDGLEGGLPVGAAVRSFDIGLNDCYWSSPAARAKGMARLSVAEFGSDEVDQNQFVKELALAVIRKIVPLALRAAASVHGEGKHKATLEQHAKTLEGQGDDLDAASAAASAAASDARYAASAAASAASAASAAASDARYAASAAASAARYAASAAASAARYAASAKAKDEVLTLAAECAVEALQKCGSYGCRWLSLVK